LETKTATQFEYEEVKDDIVSFVRLYRLAKAKGMKVQQVVHLLKLANNNLPEIEWRYRRMQREITALEFKKQQSCIALSYFKSQIEKQSQTLNSYRIYCEREIRVMQNLQNEKERLEALITDLRTIMKNILRLKKRLKRM
jgi:hypothetical protein